MVGRFFTATREARSQVVCKYYTILYKGLEHWAGGIMEPISCEYRYRAMTVFPVQTKSRWSGNKAIYLCSSMCESALRGLLIS